MQIFLYYLAYLKKKLYLCTRKGVSGIPDINQAWLMNVLLRAAPRP